jgi:hypothetical protein
MIRCGIRLTTLLVSSYIYFSEDTRVTMVDLPIYIGSVPVEALDNFDEKLS